MTDTFQYAPLLDDHTRILTIHDASNTLSCTLEDFHDEKLPPFGGLSYAWGDEAAIESILCNGKTFHITPHLHLGLRTIAHLGCAAKLWVDAICLNQHDEDEKSIHVPKMAMVYRTAVCTLGWLGPAEENSDLVIDQHRIDQITSATSHIQEPLYQHSKLINSGLPGITDPFWPALGKMCQRGWFSRLWVVQEVALARENVIICGDRMASYDSLASMMRQLCHLGFDELVLQSRAKATVDQLIGWHTFTMHTVLRLAIAQGDASPFLILYIMRMKRVSKRVDRVYGALALLDPASRDAITVDYSYEESTWWKPYVQLSAHLVVREPSLELLKIAPSMERPEGLPSWCPNCNSLGAGGITAAPGEHRAGYVNEADRKSEIEVLPNYHIKAPGFEVDRVEAIVKVPLAKVDLSRLSSSDAARLIQWEEQCLELSRQAYGGGGDEAGEDVGVPEAHWRTLILDSVYETGYNSLRSSSPAPPEYENSYSSLKQWWRFRRDNESSVNYGPNERFGEYERRLEYCKRMSFFKTEQNRIGRGPSNMRIGDRVVALYSAATLFVLRDEPGEAHSKLVGPAYVYGCMDLQTMRDEGMEIPMQFIIG